MIVLCNRCHSILDKQQHDDGDDDDGMLRWNWILHKNTQHVKFLVIGVPPALRVLTIPTGLLPLQSHGA
jgi:hypothetical protein